MEFRQEVEGFSARIYTSAQEHKTDTVGMGISPSGRFLASCSDKTELLVWSLRGEILERIGNKNK